MKKGAILFAAALSFVAAADMDARPETWFHVIGGNASKAGLTADLEALKSAGFGGIQFFHGQFGKVREWDGVEEQIPCLSAKWDDLVTHAANECARLGLTFKMQNCPGWSMSGGPWIAPSNAMRKLVYSRKDVNGQDARSPSVVPEIAIPKDCRDADSDWYDLFYLAFPTPQGDADGAPLKPAHVQKEGDVQTFSFAAPVTIRTLVLPSPSEINHAWCYTPATHVLFEAETSSGWRTVCETDYPQGCWQDRVPFSLACEEATATNWRLTLMAPHPIKVAWTRFYSGARMDNWEGQSGHVLRGLLRRAYPRQSAAAFIPAGSVRVVRPGDALAPETRWTVLRVGHVNMKKVNAPAPKEATGWECDKLDPRGIEANFVGYIGRLAKGPIAGGKLKGMIVDSWECERQTWTWRMEEYFKAATGHDVKEMIPAIFGWVIGSPAATGQMLLEWRRTLGELVTKNYYAHMADLAHAAGLTVAYETAFGDVVPGDILEFWKYCDTPMCEFWQPYTPEKGSVGHPNFKPVRPCVSAAHLYGKRRVACESFTNTSLTWDENFRSLKEQAVRHFAKGVTHFVFHTYTHQPQTDGRAPGTSFGSFIGTPFIRGETWWSFMRPFTDWIAACGSFLERGHPVVDVLRYLGDDLDHKPDELEYFPEGFKNDYLNADVLFNRLDVKDGQFVLPDGMSYAAIWVPDAVRILPATQARLDALAAKGGRIVKGRAEDAVKGLAPQLTCRPAADGPSAAPLWYHQREGANDCFFVGADERGYRGEVAFATQHGQRTLTLDLAPYETLLLEFGPDGVKDLAPGSLHRDIAKETSPQAADIPPPSRWTISFPAGWGAPDKLALGELVPWRNLPGVSQEGRSFSGTATYTANVECKLENEKCASGNGGRIMLDLGVVRDFARVFVNGREVAALWSLPYRCEVTPFVKPGTNEIKVEVTSTWFNRLAYDFGQPPEKRKTWTIWKIDGRPPPCLQPGAQLSDSGLLGPVTLHTLKTLNPKL